MKYKIMLYASLFVLAGPNLLQATQAPNKTKFDQQHDLIKNIDKLLKNDRNVQNLLRTYAKVNDVYLETLKYKQYELAKFIINSINPFYAITQKSKILIELIKSYGYNPLNLEKALNNKYETREIVGKIQKACESIYCSGSYVSELANDIEEDCKGWLNGNA